MGNVIFLVVNATISIPEGAVLPNGYPECVELVKPNGNAYRHVFTHIQADGTPVYEAAYRYEQHDLAPVLPPVFDFRASPLTIGLCQEEGDFVGQYVYGPGLINPVGDTPGCGEATSPLTGAGPTGPLTAGTGPDGVTSRECGTHLNFAINKVKQPSVPLSAAALLFDTNRFEICPYSGLRGGRLYFQVDAADSDFTIVDGSELSFECVGAAGTFCEAQVFLPKNIDNGGLSDSLPGEGFLAASCAPTLSGNQQCGLCDFEQNVFRKLIPAGQTLSTTLAGNVSYITVLGAEGVDCSQRAVNNCVQASSQFFVSYCAVTGGACVDSFCTASAPAPPPPPGAPQPPPGAPQPPPGSSTSSPNVLAPPPPPGSSTSSPTVAGFCPPLDLPPHV